MTRYLALLRGINVGGHNIIGKDDLRACFEDLGFENVRTYIQSGNVLFRAEATSSKTLAPRVEAALSARFDYDAQAVVLSHRQYTAALKAAPEAWGRADDCKHNAMFTLRSTSPARVLDAAPPPREGVDVVETGPGVIYWSVPKPLVTRSAAVKFAATKGYKTVTVRNHKTVFKLRDLFEEI